MTKHTLLVQRFFLCIASLLASFGAVSQSSSLLLTNKYLPKHDKVGRFFFKNFSIENGLPLDAFESAYTDKKGNIWFGTSGGGVSRYDGKTFFNLSSQHGIADNVVVSIIEDSKGQIWLGTKNGISCYNGKSIVNYRKDTHGVVSDVIRSVAEDKDGNLWFATDLGASKYDGKTFQSFASINGLTELSSVITDSKGNIWFGSYRHGISRYDGTSFTNFTKGQGLSSEKVATLFEDRSGKIWIGTTGGGLSCYDGHTFKTYTANEDLVNNNVWDIEQDQNGMLWFATSGGLSSFDGKKFTNYTTSNGLSTNELACLAIDKNGNLWIGNYNGGGVSLFLGAEIVNYTSSDESAFESPRVIVEDKKTKDLWIGTYDGLVKYSGGSFKIFKENEGLPSNVITSLYSDRAGQLWIATNGGGLCVWDGKGINRIDGKSRLISEYVQSMLEDSKGNRWFGYLSSGLTREAGKTITHFVDEPGLPKKPISCMVEAADGTLWFGTGGGGVCRFDGKTFSNFTVKEGLCSNTILSLALDGSGKLWIGTNDGMSRYDGETFLNFFLAEGLKNESVQELAFTTGKELAIGNNAGLQILSQFVSNEKNKPGIAADNPLPNTQLISYQPQFETYNMATGFPIKAIAGEGPSSLIVDGQGIIWMATSNLETGVVRFNYNAVRKEKDAPVTLITDVRFDEQTFSWYSLMTSPKPDSVTLVQQEKISAGKILLEKDRQTLRSKLAGVTFTDVTPYAPLPVNLTLPYSHNQLVFHFNGLDLSNNSQLHYQYKLDGEEEEEWSTEVVENTVTYNNLFEGSYVFHVRAKHKQKNDWGNEATFSFTVLPPWYRTWWAYVIYAVFTVVGFVAAVKWRSKRLETLNLQLERAIQIRTEEITAQNEELMMQQEEIVTQREQIEYQNKNLETTVAIRTQELATSLKEQEHQFQKLEQFSFITAHNLRSPVARILGLVSIFNRTKIEDPINLTVLDKTVDAAKDLDVVVHDLGEILNIKKGQKEEVKLIDLKDLTEKIIQRFATEIETENIAINFQSALARIYSVPAYLDSILTNLISNAIKYKDTDRPACINISAEEVEGNHHKLVVEDNGVGFDSEKYDSKLFEPFQRFNTQKQGKGLGLYLVKTQVIALGGTIHLKSYPDKGTRVEIWLPTMNDISDSCKL